MVFVHLKELHMLYRFCPYTWKEKYSLELYHLHCHRLCLDPQPYRLPKKLFVVTSLCTKMIMKILVWNMKLTVLVMFATFIANCPINQVAIWVNLCCTKVTLSILRCCTSIVYFAVMNEWKYAVLGITSFFNVIFTFAISFACLTCTYDINELIH